MRGKVSLYLGKRGSAKYVKYKKAVERRRQLKELERRYKRLVALYEKSLMDNEVSNSKTQAADEAVEVGNSKELPTIKIKSGSIVATEHLVNWMMQIEETQLELKLLLTKLTANLQEILGNDYKLQRE